MRSPILGALVFAASVNASAECLDATHEVTLPGTVTTRDYPGPPNYQDIAQGDQKQTVFLLELDGERCLRDGETTLEFSELQLAFDWASPRGSAVYQEVASANTPLTLRGELFPAATREHRTPWLLLVSDASREDSR